MFGLALLLAIEADPVELRLCPHTAGVSFTFPKHGTSSPLKLDTGLPLRSRSTMVYYGPAFFSPQRHTGMCLDLGGPGCDTSPSKGCLFEATCTAKTPVWTITRDSRSQYNLITHIDSTAICLDVFEEKNTLQGYPCVGSPNQVVSLSLLIIVRYTLLSAHCTLCSYMT